jgi:iron complex transport system substrate-binding protein
MFRLLPGRIVWLMTPCASKFKERIVSLAPNATSILFAIGARRCVVGVSKWCADVAPVGCLPRVGDCWKLDVGEVAALRPTLIVGSVPFRPEVVAELLKLPPAFVALNPRTLEDIYADVRRLGGLVNRRAAAEKLISRMKKQFAAIGRLAARTKSRPRIYAEAWPNPRISSPPWVAELVNLAGGKMIVPPGERVTDAQVAKAAPEVMILAWTATGQRADPRRTLQNLRWRAVPAIKNRRVVVIRDELLNTPGPPLIEGARALLRAIHPELTQ